jgi:hypothetical protein
MTKSDQNVFVRIGYVVWRALVSTGPFNLYGWFVGPWVLLACDFTPWWSRIFACAAALVLTAWVLNALFCMGLPTRAYMSLGAAVTLAFAGLFYVLPRLPRAPVFALLLALSALALWDLARQQTWALVQRPRPWS